MSSKTPHIQIYIYIYLGMTFFLKKSHKNKVKFLRFCSINVLSDDVQNSVVNRPTSFTMHFTANKHYQFTCFRNSEN